MIDLKPLDLSQIATAEQLQERREDISNKYDGFMDALKKRRSHLQQALKFGYWQKDAAELKKIIEDHLILARADHVGQTAVALAALNDLERDNKASKSGLDRLVSSGKEMIMEDHFAKTEIQRTIDNLLELMSMLEEALLAKRKRLEHQQRVDDFRSNLRNMSVWIDEKLPAATSDNFGSTLDEVVALQASLVRLDNEVNASESSMKDHHEEAKELDLEAEFQEVRGEWNQLRDKLAERREKLLKSYAIHKFMEECDHLTNFIGVRQEQVNSMELTTSIPQCEQFLRNHDRALQEARANQPRLESLEKQLETIEDESCKEKLEEVEAAWAHLMASMEHQAKTLRKELRILKFEDQTKVYTTWATETIEVIKAVELPSDEHELEQILETFEAQKEDAESRTVQYEFLIVEAIEVEEEAQCEDLKSLNAELLELIDEKTTLYEQAREYFKFAKDGDCEIKWISQAESAWETLATCNLDSVAEAEQALVEQKALTSELEARQPKVQQLLALKIKFQEENADNIKSLLHAKLEELSAIQAKQHDKIVQALKLHHFNNDANELGDFIDQKSQTLDECDAADLQDIPAKEQKLTSVRNDIAANQCRLKKLQDDSEELPEYASVDSKLEEVVEKWDKLLADVNRLHIVLEEAEQAAAFKRACDEVESWMDNNGPKIMSIETGKDIEATKELLDNQKALADEFTSQDDKIKGLEAQVTRLLDSGNFKADELEDQIDKTRKRYDENAPHVTKSEERLNKALRDLELLRNIKEQRDIAAEQRTLLGSDFKPKDIISAEAALNKIRNLKSEVASSDQKTEELVVEAEKSENDDIKGEVGKLLDERKALTDAIDAKEEELNNALQSFTYLSDAAEADDWINEKMIAATVEQVGTDEDEADAMLKKHVSLCDDIKAFEKNIDALAQARQACAVQHIDLEPDHQEMKVVKAYQAQLPRELTVNECDVVKILSNPGGEWVKVAKGSSSGYIPSECLVYVDDDGKSKELIDLKKHQDALKANFEKLNENADERRAALEKQNKKFELDREAEDLRVWIVEQEEALKHAQNEGEDPEALRKNFEQFQKNQRQAEKALTVLKEKAAVIDIVESPSLQAMDDKWKDLEALADDTESQIGGASRLKQFLGESGQIAAWIQRKNVPSEVPDTLNRTNAMIRRHDAVEADMNAIQERVDLLIEQEPKLTEELPESKPEIDRTIDSIKTEWEDLKARQAAHRDALNKRQKLLDFMSKAASHENWIRNMKNQLEKLQCSSDLAIIEAQILQHSGHNKIISVKKDDLAKILAMGEEVEDSKDKVDEKSETLNSKSAELDALWDKVQKDLDEAAKLARFERDCERFANWMELRENALRADGDDQNEEILKNDDFHRSIKQQQGKVQNILKTSEKLIEEGHSQSDKINDDKDNIIARWKALKSQLTDRHEELAAVQTLQEFWKNADEFSEWLNEKIIIAEQPINDTNLNQGLQRHNAFRSEIEANMDRLQSILSAGEMIVQKNIEQADIVNKRTTHLKDKSEELHKLTDQKTKAYEDAVKVREYIAACNALVFWIVETKTQLDTAEAKDLASAAKNIKKVSQIQADIANKSATRDALLKEFDEIKEDEKATASKQKLVEDFDSLQLQVEAKRNELGEALKLYQFLADADEENGWCKEKDALLRHIYGYPPDNLMQANSNCSQHKLLEYEIETRSVKIADLLTTGKEIGPDAAEKVDELEKTLKALEETVKLKGIQLDEVLEDLQFQSNVNEEISWASDKERRLQAIDPSAQPIGIVRTQLQKLHSLKVDIDAHEANAKKLEDEKENDPIIEHLRLAFIELIKTFTLTLKTLEDREAFLGFNRKCQYCSDWIADRRSRLAAENIMMNDMTMISALLIKQDNLEDSLKSFESEGINATEFLLVELQSANHAELEQAELKWEEIKLDWDELKRQTQSRRESLEHQRSKLRGYDELCIEFAKKAGAFNSWFENVEENLTDPITSGSVKEVENRFRNHEKDVKDIKGEEPSIINLRALDEKIRTVANIEDNPYTWYHMEELEGIWAMTATRLTERMKDLEEERTRQVRFDEMRMKFADFANKFAEFISSIRSKLHHIAHASLEDQLNNVIDQEKAVRGVKRDLDLIEKLHDTMGQELITDNEYTKHSALGLSQSWDGIIQMCQRMQRSLKAQIEARSKTGISEERIQEWRECFEYFDSDNTGMLDFIGMKSLFRSLGVDLALKEGDQESDDFLEILSQLDLSCESAVSKDEFISYMITRETTQVKCKDDIVAAFTAIADPEQPYITESELRKNLTSEQAEYCLRVMPTYQGPDAPVFENTLDYHKFLQEYFK